MPSSLSFLASENASPFSTLKKIPNIQAEAAGVVRLGFMTHFSRGAERAFCMTSWLSSLRDRFSALRSKLASPVKQRLRTQLLELWTLLSKAFEGFRRLLEVALCLFRLS